MHSSKLFLGETITTSAVECINIYIEFIATNFWRDRDARQIDMTEIQAIIRFLYLGVQEYKSSQVNIHDIGIPVENHRISNGIVFYNHFSFYMWCSSFYVGIALCYNPLFRKNWINRLLQYLFLWNLLRIFDMHLVAENLWP